MEKILPKLPQEARKELLDYAEFLLAKYGAGKRKGFSFPAQVKLKDVKMTSVELQHRAFECTFG